MNQSGTSGVLIAIGTDFEPIKFNFAFISALFRAPVQRVPAPDCDNDAAPNVSISHGG
jgi:hypothetical protein